MDGLPALLKKEVKMMSNQNKIKLNWLTVIILIIFWGVCASFYPYLPDQYPHTGI
ncbi:hypothetical protein N752_15250 [Desulforamulus aquiferis]|nr:hypothetical protein N752_15250 [Desulforamulus aquiferis]